MKKVKVAILEDKKAKKATSKKMTKAVLKKLGELWQLCTVKTCLILFLRPSKEGVQELCSKFMDFSLKKKKKLVNQRMAEPDQKDDGGLQNLCEEKVREKGESFSSLHPPSLRCTPDVFQRWYDHKVPSQNLFEDYDKDIHAFTVVHNSIPIQKEPVQFNCQALYDFYAKIPQMLEAFNKRYNINVVPPIQKEPVQFNRQALYDFYAKIPQMLDDFNKKYNINPNHNLIPYSRNIDLMDLETNPRLNEEQGFMDTSEEEMDDAEENESVSSVGSSSARNPY